MGKETAMPSRDKKVKSRMAGRGELVFA